MEDIPRNIQRDVAQTLSAPSQKRRGRWTLLLVGDDGEVIAFRRFAGWVAFYAMLLVAAVAAAGAFWFISRSPVEKNRRLTREIIALREQLASVRSEKDLLMARMVVSATGNTAPSRASAVEAPAPAPQPAQEAPAPETAQAAVGAQEKHAAGQSESAKAALPAIAANTETAPTENAVASPVDVEDLQVTKDDDSQMLHARFMLKKVDSDEGSVTGRTFVILKENSGTTSRWISMPAVPLEKGRPSRIRGGRYFAISRFNIVKFSTPYAAPAGAFTKATILVYSLQGKLLLEKSFDVQVSVGAPPGQDIGE